MRWRGKGGGRYGSIARSSISNTPYAPGCGAWDTRFRGLGCTHGVRVHGSSIARRRQLARRDGECVGGSALLRVPDASSWPFLAPRFSTQRIFISGALAGRVLQDCQTDHSAEFASRPARSQYRFGILLQRYASVRPRQGDRRRLGEFGSSLRALAVRHPASVYRLNWWGH